MASIASARARARVGQSSYHDTYMIVLVAVLSLFGLVTIWSASGGGVVTAGSPVARQAVYAIAGVGVMFALSSVHYRFLKAFAPVFYLASVLALLSLNVIGTTIG